MGLHLLVKVDLLHREISGFNLARSNEHAIPLSALKILLSLDSAHRCLSVDLRLREKKRNTDDPSFFPIGSSYSTPTQIPGANFVLPTNRTVPRLWKPGSLDSIWHLEPTWMLMSSSVSRGSSSGCSAKRPSFWRCLYARTVSEGESLRERCRPVRARGLPLR